MAIETLGSLYRAAGHEFPEFQRKDTINIAAQADWYKGEGYKRIAAILGAGLSTYTGKPIGVAEALRCSIVWVCTRAITEPLASMPLPLLQRKGDETRQAKDRPLYQVLQSRPNGYQTAKTFRRTLTHHALNYGNGYAQIFRRSDGDKPVIGLQLIHPTSVIKIEQEDGGTLTYLVKDRSGKEQPMPGRDVFHIQNLSDDGISGLGVIDFARQSIALALALEEYGALFFARGGMPAGMLKKTIPFSSDEDRKRFREDLGTTYQNIDQSHKWLMLEGDWDFKAFGIDPEKAQFLLLRQFMVAELCRYYGLSPHLAADLSRATFSNIEELALEFIQYTEMPWMVAWEEEIQRSLLTDRERDQGYYAKHNANFLMRGDFEKRMRGYASQLQNGVLSINEVRELEERDPVEGGDAHHIQLNMQTVAGTGEPTASETAKTPSLVKISNGKRPAA